MITRRLFVAGLSSLGLAACSRSMPGLAATRGASDLPADLRPAPNAAYDAWVTAFRQRAEGQGIERATLASAFRGAGFLPGVVTRDRNQTEFNRTLEDYLSNAAAARPIPRYRTPRTITSSASSFQ